MQISIWGQFASNHSAGFTVVATFKTLESAYAAADNLRQTLKTVQDWHDEHRQANPYAYLDVAIQPTEDIIGEQGLNEAWYATIDPVCYNFSETVTILDRLMIVSDPKETWMSREPFFSLVKSLGGSVAGWDLGTERHFTTLYEMVLTCTAPDEAVAQSLYNNIHHYFVERDRPSGFNDIPQYAPPWHEFEGNFEHARQRPDSLLDGDQLANVLERRPKWRPDVVQLSVFHTANPIIKRDGLNLSIDGLLFANVAFAMAALIGYLEAHGCSHIDYHLVPIDESGE